jgi:hypothetical protein
VITCPNCGTENEPGDRFCRECGADLRALAATQPEAPLPAQTNAAPLFPPPPIPQPPGQWYASPIAPLPASKPRRTWLWIVIGLLAACLLCCCVGGVYVSTSSGKARFDRVTTRVSDWLTEVAPTPTP